MPNFPNPLRNLPSVNQLLESEPLKKLVDRASHNAVASGVRQFLDELRSQVASAREDISIPTASELAEKIAKWLELQETPSLRPVINATGVLLHTGLGRAPLCEEAIVEIQRIAPGYASVELDLETGERGQRVRAVERLLCELTGAEAALVVNNNAAATMITLSALARDREVIVSRGQLIEIGGSYRLPDVMAMSGARLREVGTTNKTHILDYQNAINESTAALLKVHPSNFQVVGFTNSVSLKEMVKVARAHDLPVIDDVGSGALIDFSKYGLQDEPIVTESIRDGADLVLFSGDKLVGGPQCGVIVGRRRYIDMIMKYPLMRALRVGKLTLAALRATLLLYRDPKHAETRIPLLRMLSTPLENLHRRAESIASQIGHLEWLESAVAEPSHAMLGGGSVPTQQIDSWCVALTPTGMTVDKLASELRHAAPAIVGRISQERLILDLRTVEPANDIRVVETILELKP